MKGHEESLFFEHDLATPLSNLTGATHLLEASVGDSGAGAAEAVEILKRSIKTLEKMLYWYWEARKIEEGYEPSPPWKANLLHAAACKAIETHVLPLSLPAEGCGLDAVALTVPEVNLVAALIGAGLSFQAASGMDVAWEIGARNGVCFVSYRIEGGGDRLDAAAFFRKSYHPQQEEIRGRFDGGLPYLTAILSKSGGGRELIWRDNQTRLEIWLG